MTIETNPRLSNRFNKSWIRSSGRIYCRVELISRRVNISNRYISVILVELDVTGSPKAGHISLGGRGGENSALWGKLNGSESRQVLQNEWETSVSPPHSLSQPFCFIFLPFLCHSCFPFLPPSLWPSSLSHPGCVMPPACLRNISASLLLKQKHPLETRQDSGVISSRGVMCSSFSLSLSPPPSPPHPLWSGVSCAECGLRSSQPVPRSDDL